MKNIFSFLVFLLLANFAHSQVLTESNLPILIIDSGINQIGEDRVDATMKVFFKEDGSINKITDVPEDYDGNIGIKWRGQSSLSAYEKKGYSIKTRDELGEDDAVNLLGMPKESEWVLHGPYADKSLMRNALLYTLADNIMPYAPRVQMVEIIVNDDYKGVYLFTEKIKRDADRVDVSKLKDEDISGDEVTGGYILKFDKADADEIGWTSPYSISSDQQANFVLVYPEADDIQPEQKAYIQNWMTNFEDVLAGPNYTDSETGYRKLIKTETFIENILINEMSRNVDGYRLSTYMFKDKDNNDDELHLGPVWDYNFAFGNADYCNGSNIDGWAYNFNDICSNDFFQVHFWWKRLLTDPTFEADLKEKWMTLRNGKFTDAKITELIDSFEDQLAEPQQRNFQRWSVLGEYIWPNPFVGDTYKQEVDYLRQWIMDRMHWMDEAFDIELAIDETLSRAISLSPNPVSSTLEIRNNTPLTKLNIEIINIHGQSILMQTIGSNSILDLSHLSSGTYFVHFIGNKEIETKRFVKL